MLTNSHTHITHAIIYTLTQSYTYTQSYTHIQPYTHSHTIIHTLLSSHTQMHTLVCTLTSAHTLTQEPRLGFPPLIAPFPVLHKILTERGDGGAPSLLNTHLQTQLWARPISILSHHKPFHLRSSVSKQSHQCPFYRWGNFPHHYDISGRVAFHLWITKDSFYILIRSQRKIHPCSSHPVVLERGGGGTWRLGYSDAEPISQLRKLTGRVVQGGGCANQ